MKKQAKRTAKREKLARDMTMRERIAMEAMVAIICKTPSVTVGIDGHTEEMLNEKQQRAAGGAVGYADALMSELEGNQ